MRLAWFSPMPPVRSGPALDSAHLVAALGRDHEIDVFVDEPVARAWTPDVRVIRVDPWLRVDPRPRSAHDFVWLHRQRPYDLTVFQLGNSSNHDYLWPYLFRYPGLTVLHDVHLHHARAAALLRARRAADYRAEFAANHPDALDGAAELAVAGFDSYLYYQWPMTRLVVQASRLSAVHSSMVARELKAELPHSRIETIRLGHGTLVPPERELTARAAVRSRVGVPADAVLFGCFGGVTPDKRIPQILDALHAVVAYAPSAHLLIAGAAAEHYDVRGDIRARGLEPRVTVTGYIATDEELTDCIAAVDVALNLRWPTAREVSGPWLRCLAAGKPTIVIDLLQTAGVPSVDPRTWTTRHSGAAAVPLEPVCVAIDVLDEDHSLRRAMRRLALDPPLRASLGRAAREYWIREHSVEGMVEDYRRVLRTAAEGEAPDPPLPAHLRDDGSRVLREVTEPFGPSVTARIRGI